MNLDVSHLIRELITLFVVIDPIGTLPVFYFATAGMPERLHWRFAVRAVTVAGIVLLLFLVGGQLLLEGLGLRIGSFQIAGGIVLFIFAMTMIFGESRPEEVIHEAERSSLAGAVFPLAIPSIASPGAMLAIVILTDNEANPIADQLITAAMLCVVLGITLILLLLASRLKRIFGETGASVISRVMGIILATVAVDSVLGGLDAVGVLTLTEEGALNIEE